MTKLIVSSYNAYLFKSTATESFSIETHKYYAIFEMLNFVIRLY
jgi:hypothetical protein